MFHKTKFLTALLCSILITAVNVEAQIHRPKSRVQLFNKNRNSYKRNVDKSVTLVGGAGLSVLNSDNRGHNFGRDGLKPLGNNGFGQNISVGAMYKLTPMVGVLGSVDYNRFRAAEDMHVESSNDVSFKSDAIQATGSVVVNLINGYYGYGVNRRRVFMIPYVRAGVGIATYKATSFLKGDGEKITELTDLRVYPGIAAVVPVGFGLDFECSRAVSIAPEFTFTFTSSDYLDNIVDPAGYSGKNDQFLNASVKVYYKPSAKRKTFRRRR